MTVKKRSGRQSVEVAEETRRRILKTVLELCVEKGFNGLSLREVGQRADVSHGLLRYHFGSKQEIVRHLCDRVYENFQSLIEHLMKNLDRERPINYQFFHLLTRLQAYLLLNPSPMVLMADGFNSSGELRDYFVCRSGTFDEGIQGFCAELKEEGYMKGLAFDDIKWLLFMFIQVPVSYRQLMARVYESKGNEQEHLLEHWSLFAKLMAAQLDIGPEEVSIPESLYDLVEPELQYMISDI